MLVTLKLLKDYLNIEVSDPADDSFLTTLMASMQSEIEGYINQPLEAAEQTTEYNGKSTNWMLLNHKPVNSITSLKERDEPTDDWETAISTDDYKLVEKNSVYKLYYANTFERGIQNYQVIANTGYTTIPSDIQQIVKEMVAVSLRDSPRGEFMIGKSSVGINRGGFSENTKFEDLWLTRWTKMLEKYEIPLI